MSKKRVNEWNIKAPWGQIAMISWGDPNHPPMLLVHGYMDTAATFAILVDQLPDKYHYVAFDMPGHGKSDPFPKGLLVTQLHIVEVVRLVVAQMKWRKFIYMSHSMGCVVGWFYHHIYPEFIKRMIFLDPALPLAMYYMTQNRPALWFHLLYTEYYDNYQRWNFGKPRLHTFDSAISLLVRNRSLTEEQAEIALSRSLIPMGIDTYKLSWEPRMKKTAQITVPEETLYTIMTTKSPPTLVIDASEIDGEKHSKNFAENLLHKCEQTLDNFYRVTVMGGHDIHIINPEAVGTHIVDFLDSNVRKLKYVFKKKCKL